MGSRNNVIIADIVLDGWAVSVCDCREKADAALGKYNTRIKRIYSLGSGMPWSIETEQVTKGRGQKQAMGLHASYCPLCGVSLKPTPTQPGDARE